MAISAEQTDWRDIIFKGVEGQQLDYKAAQDWNDLSRAERAKFARHAMAMANTLGGYIVVGVGEDNSGNPTLRTGMTEKQARSFDPSSVGQTINRYADPSVEFDLVKPEVDGKLYVVFVVYPFRNLPHVCGDSCELELQRGVFYIRTPDARSRAAYRASELHALVQRALRNQRQLLGRMIRGVLYEGRQPTESSAAQEFQRLIARCRQEARAALGAKRCTESVMFEVAAYPADFLIDRFTLSDIDRARDAIVLPVEGVIPAPPPDGAVSYMTNESVRAYQREHSEFMPSFYWEFFICGLSYCVLLDEAAAASRREVSYLLLLRRVGAAVYAIGQMVTELGLEAELLTLVFRLSNTEGAYLVLPAAPEGPAYRCFIPDIEVTKERTAADLVSAPAPNAANIIREICERFGFRGDEHVGLNQRLETLLRQGQG